ncbi:MAG: hypothetical protein WD271_13395, partial [Acidimicrobiia bacterium]
LSADTRPQLTWSIGGSRLKGDSVLSALRDAPTFGRRSALTPDEREDLKNRLDAMATAGRYDAGIAVAALGGNDELVIQRAIEARDRVLARAEPDEHTFSFGTNMVPDSYLVTFLAREDRRACLEKLLTIAEDPREAAPNRQEALIAACNLVVDEDEEYKEKLHIRSHAVADGHHDGSLLDAETTHPHPLSTMKIDFGSSSLRANGLRLAHFTAIRDDQKKWVRDRAVAMLGSDDTHEVHAAARTLAGLPVETLSALDSALLAAHPLPVVRQLAVVVATAQPSIYSATLAQLAMDPESSVRIVLAHRLAERKLGEHTGAKTSGDEATVDQLLVTLSRDVRHSVRFAAAGLNRT